MKDQLKRLPAVLAAALIVFALAAAPASGAIWSTTELHLQYGTLDVPGFAQPPADKDTTIFTLQHASGWKYGDNFFFFDVISSDGGGFNDTETYGEWYTYLSPRKMSGKEMMKGALKDVRLLMGFNWSADADVIKYLPGIGLSWNPGGGFIFLNTDITLYIDGSVGIVPNGGGAPSEDDSFMVDVNWAWMSQNKKFSIEGHAEYIGERTNEFNQTVEAWILAQPQFRYWLNENLALGVEYQFWQNKLGDPNTDESTVQALLVWRF